MTAKCLGLVSWKSRSRAWTRTLPPIIRGMMIRLMRNVLVRTAARYSRRAMTSILYTAVLLPGGGRPVGVGAGDAHEDVVQRRPGQLEVVHLAALHQPGQQPLGVGAGQQPQFLPAAEV